MAVLGRTGIDVFPLCLGGNVFGWTADESQSIAVLDAYAAAGGNLIDTANSYTIEHGRSETIIGRWMAHRGNREEVVVATKVGGGRGAVRNLRAQNIRSEAYASLQRLQTDYIDLYYASARTTDQLEQILPAATLELAPAEVERLSARAVARI
jgi:aryl-alcohol dehydrogenase-like predicted oxidoreductase